MLCENCKHNAATVKYTQIINGKKQEMMLCEKCSRELGIDYSMDFNMPIDFSSFLGDLISDYQDTRFMPIISNLRELKCDNCNTSYDEFLNTGRLGCSECYATFEEQMDSILKRIQGTNRHIGKKLNTKNIVTKDENKTTSQKQSINKLEKLQEDLKIAVKEERYEDAAKLRDEIKKANKK